MDVDRKYNISTFELHVMLIYISFMFMCYIQQFRDATLELLSCGRYFPRTPALVSIHMHSMNSTRVTPLSRNVKMNSKVLPV